MFLIRARTRTEELTRGAGIPDVTNSLWLLLNPICSQYKIILQANIGVVYKNSGQHKTCMKKPEQRPAKRLRSCSPFADNPALQKIINGITADKKVTADKFIKIGQEIIDKLPRHDVFT